MNNPAKIPIPAAFDANRRPVTFDRPRLLGSRLELQNLASQRPEAYKHMMEMARANQRFGGHEMDARIFALAIANVVEGDKVGGRAIVDLVLKRLVDRPIRKGHVTFATDLARTAIAYDLCHDLWTADERKRGITYMHATIDANTGSEPSVFHNGWYGYKHWGYGMAGYALMHDDAGAPKILADLEHAYKTLAVPALELAGAGGGWAEGFYVHYWLDSWLYFCETARMVEGLDYYAAAPDFYSHRAVASMFEHFPTLMQNGSRRPIPIGDSHGRTVNHVRDQALTARRILVNHYRDDPAHQAVHAYNLQTPKVANPYNYHMDFLWNDQTVTAGDLDAFKLSHFSSGPGFVYARSSWKEDATHFYFKSGRRFTAHQHLDNGHFLIFKNQELIGDGGHYGAFDSNDAVNYYTRTIAHNSILIRDPDETWPHKCPETPLGMRAGPPAHNDGGQDFPWSAKLHHNGGATNVQQWLDHHELMEIGTVPAFKDHGHYLYAAGDYTKSYSANKAKCVTRQIVFLRPNTFIIFDRVISTNAGFKKSFLLQTAKIPEQSADKNFWMVGNPGPSEKWEGGTAPKQPGGKLFIQILEPAAHTVDIFYGDDLYRYTHGGDKYAPRWLDPPAPECRMEISPVAAAQTDYFLHALTVADAGVAKVPLATHHFEGRELVVTVGPITTRIAVAPNL